jgi:hypothetical protein
MFTVVRQCFAFRIPRRHDRSNCWRPVWNDMDAARPFRARRWTVVGVIATGTQLVCGLNGTEGDKKALLVTAYNLGVASVSWALLSRRSTPGQFVETLVVDACAPRRVGLGVAADMVPDVWVDCFIGIIDSM